MVIEIRVSYDDSTQDVLSKVNKALTEAGVGIALVNDECDYDGYEIYVLERQ